MGHVPFRFPWLYSPALPSTSLISRARHSSPIPISLEIPAAVLIPLPAPTLIPRACSFGRSLTFGVPLSAKCYLGPCFRPPTQAAARTMLPAHLPPSGLPSQVHGLTSACSGLRSSSLEQVLHLPGLGAVQLCSSGGAAAQKSHLLPVRTIRLTDPHPSMSFKVV